MVITIISMISGTLGIALAFNPNLSQTQRLVLIILSLLITFLGSYFSLLRKHRKLLKTFKDTTQKHKALSVQFSEKSNLLTRYRLAFSYISRLMLQATLVTEEDKVNKMFETFILIQNQINDGGNNNE